eukprot:gene8406-231_t
MSIKSEPCTDFYTHTTAFELLETLKDENDFDFSILPEDTIISSPESYGSSSTEDDFDVQSLISGQNVNSQTDSLVSSFLNENDKTSSKKRRREKKEEVDPKKQQRLIKNRESAQASRERKKNYVKDLEGTVSNLTSNNRDLSTKVLSLEEENNRLREQLQRAMKGEKIEQSQLPPAKKQKVYNQKLPLPPMQQMPFLQAGYWLNMFKGGNIQQTQPQQQQQQQKTEDGEQWQGPKVVLFVALFCVALFLVKTPQGLGDSSKSVEGLKHHRIGRILQSTTQDDVTYLFESLQKEPSQMESALNKTIGDIKVKWNQETEKLAFVFPSSLDSQDQQEKTREISISKQLFSEICDELK